MKFFSSDENKYCKYCAYSIKSDSEAMFFCSYKGVINANDSCKKFKYDILKREPKRIKPAANYKPEDFSL